MKRGPGFVAADPAQGLELERKARRKTLLQNGLALGASVGTAETPARTKTRPDMLGLLRQEAARLNLTQPVFTSYNVKPAASLGAMAKTAFAPSRNLQAVHFTIGRAGQRDPSCLGLAGVEIHEYIDSVTIHPFESK
jgi:hypothetical protein